MLCENMHKTYYLFSVIFSIYAVLLFGDLCKPNDDDKDEERWDWNKTVNCKKWSNGTNGPDDDDTSTEYKTTQVTWVLLVIFTVYFWLREVLKLVAEPRTFLSRMESYGDLAIDILLICSLYKGFPHDARQFERWQYHVATFTSFLLWVQTMLTLGKYPGYGKYIIMFK